MRKKKGGKGLLTIKLDLEKAYDQLRWGFIKDSLYRMGLPSSFITMIMNCVTSCTLNILWNGEPTKSFQPTRGVR